MKALLNIFKHLKSKSWAIAKIVPSWFATLEKTSFSSRFWPLDSKLRYGIFQAWKTFKWVLKLSQWKVHLWNTFHCCSKSPIHQFQWFHLYKKKRNANMLNYWDVITVTILSLSELKVSWTGITARSTKWFISNRSIKWFLTIPGFGTCICIVGAVWIITPVGVTGPCTGEYLLFCSSCSITDEGSGISVISYRPAYQKKQSNYTTYLFNLVISFIKNI